MPKLILTSGDNRQEYELGAFNTVGRHPDNTVQILDRIVSKEHCQIIRTEGGRFLLRDLGSLNGTYVSGQRVKEQVLADGDEIVLGSSHLTYVEVTEEQEQLERVTFSPGVVDSHIRQKIEASPDFVPEKSLTDEKTLRRDYEKLRISHELSRAIVGVLDLEQLLPKILDKAFEILPADRGVILLIDPDQGNGQLVPRYVKVKDKQGDD